MKQKRWNIVVLLVVAALVAVSLIYIFPPGKKTHLGLDLQGGLEVVYKAQTATGTTPSSAQISQTIDIMNRRVNGLGVTESAVQRQGSDQISVSLPGIKNAQQALKVIGEVAQLEFYDDANTRVAGPADTLADVIKQARQQTRFVIPKADWAKLADPTGPQPTDYIVLTAKPGVAGKGTTYFIYKNASSMNGSDVKSARQSFNGTEPNVLIDFTSKGSKLFQSITRDLWLRGSLMKQSQTFAIVLDTVIETDPMIDYTDSSLRDGISGGAEIRGGDMTVTDAQDLALVLNIGALPTKLTEIYDQQVSATLGKDSLRQALLAGLAGFGVVLIYMLFYYRFLGLIADMALLIYAMLLWGVFNFIPVTLTLPGIAGMMLTIGVAADANVVIFERIKEEVRAGKTVRSAISAGYARGFKTILDANVLTLLTALVLFMFASAQPKGFAFTLILGVLVSMFTAILATRALLGLLADFTFFNKAAFMGVSAAQIRAAELRAAADQALYGGVPSSGGRRQRRARPAVQAAAAGPATATATPARKDGSRRPTTRRKKKRR
jgi:protein-export membrane protein SecD